MRQRHDRGSTVFLKNFFHQQFSQGWTIDNVTIFTTKSDNYPSYLNQSVLEAYSSWQKLSHELLDYGHEDENISCKLAGDHPVNA
jgi:hypothetical protein